MDFKLYVSFVWTSPNHSEQKVERHEILRVTLYKCFASAVGIILGGLIIFALKIRGKNLPLMVVILQLLAIPITAIYLLSCPTTQIPGVTVSFTDGSVRVTKSRKCVYGSS